MAADLDLENDQGVSERRKKSITAALFGLARDGYTTDPRLAAVLRAQKINLVMGGARIMPWEVDEIPLEWQQLLYGFADDLPDMQKTAKEQSEIAQSWRNRHGYRSYLKGKK